MKDRTILLVEDNPSDIGLARRALEKKHITSELVVAEDGEAALEYMFGTGAHAGREVKDLPAVILLDLKLPKLDGLSVLRRLREDKRTELVRVVVLTTSREDRDLLESYRLGATSYIRKPVDFDRFADAVANLGLYWLVLNEPPPENQ